MSAYSTLVLGDGPRGYWRLGEAALPVNDSSGNGINFTGGVGGTIVYAQPSLLTSDTANKSINFTNGWLSRGTAAPLDVRDVFTIEAWVKLNTLTHAYMSIYSNWSGAQYLRISNANQLQLLADSAALICTSTYTFSDLNVHHVVATKNGATVKLYVDGVDRTGTVSNYTFTGTPAWLAIGSTPGGGGEPANQVMDEVAIYPVALSQAQVLAHYNAGTAVSSSPQTVSVPGVPSAQAFGVPKTNVRFAVAGVPPAQAFGTPTTRTVVARTVVGLGSSQSFGTPTIRSVRVVAVAGVPSAQAFGSTKTGQIVPVQGVLPYGEQVFSVCGEPVCGDGHLCGYYGGFASQFGQVTVATGPVSVAVAGAPSAQALGAPDVFVVWTRVLPCVDLDLDLAACLSAPGLAVVGTFLCGTKVAYGHGYLVPEPPALVLDLVPAGCA